MSKEELGCLGVWKVDEDFVLCNGNSDLLPKLFKKDEIRYEYNQNKWEWSVNSCTIFSALWEYSDLTNYEFSEKEIKEIDDFSYQPIFTHIRLPWKWWYVKDAHDCVRKYVNWRKDLVEKYGKIASYCISKYDEDIIEDALNNLYTIGGNYHPTTEYNKDRSDGMLDWTDFWTQTNWHAVGIISKDWQRSVKDSYKGRKFNIYWLKNKLSQISNFWEWFYIFTLVKEDNYEEIKRLNEFKAGLTTAIEHNSKLWHLTNDKNYQAILHYVNEKHRAKVKDVDIQLAKYI